MYDITQNLRSVVFLAGKDPHARAGLLCEFRERSQRFLNLVYSIDKQNKLIGLLFSKPCDCFLTSITISVNVVQSNSVCSDDLACNVSEEIVESFEARRRNPFG